MMRAFVFAFAFVFVFAFVFAARFVSCQPSPATAPAAPGRSG